MLFPKSWCEQVNVFSRVLIDTLQYVN